MTKNFDNRQKIYIFFFKKKSLPKKASSRYALPYNLNANLKTAKDSASIRRNSNEFNCRIEGVARPTCYHMN
jgi:hypothetical protein